MSIGIVAKHLAKKTLLAYDYLVGDDDELSFTTYGIRVLIRHETVTLILTDSRYKPESKTIRDFVDTVFTKGDGKINRFNFY